MIKSSSNPKTDLCKTCNSEGSLITTLSRLPEYLLIKLDPTHKLKDYTLSYDFDMNLRENLNIRVESAESPETQYDYELLTLCEQLDGANQISYYKVYCRNT